jgi:hypothetical protein
MNILNSDYRVMYVGQAQAQAFSYIPQHVARAGWTIDNVERQRPGIAGKRRDDFSFPTIEVV